MANRVSIVRHNLSDRGRRAGLRNTKHYFRIVSELATRLINEHVDISIPDHHIAITPERVRDFYYESNRINQYALYIVMAMSMIHNQPEKDIVNPAKKLNDYNEILAEQRAKADLKHKEEAGITPEKLGFGGRRMTDTEG